MAWRLRGGCFSGIIGGLPVPLVLMCYVGAGEVFVGIGWLASLCVVNHCCHVGLLLPHSMIYCYHLVVLLNPHLRMVPV